MTVHQAHRMVSPRHAMRRPRSWFVGSFPDTAEVEEGGSERGSARAPGTTPDVSRATWRVTLAGSGQAIACLSGLRDQPGASAHLASY